MKVRISAFFSSVLVISGVAATNASTLSNWAGPTTATLSADFDRYDIDTKTGKMQGPLKGHLQLQRPGYFTLSMADQQIKIAGGKLDYIACANCKPISIATADVIDTTLLKLIEQGENAESRFSTQSQFKIGPSEVNETYSLAALGISQGNLNLSFYEGQPTVAELSLTSQVKTIIQFYNVQRSFVELQEKAK